MDLKELISKYGLAIVIIIIIGSAIYIFFYCGETVDIAEHGYCDNTGRFDDKMKSDSCIMIDSIEAQALFSKYISIDGTGPFGAWIGKELLDTLFSGNDSNGVFVMLGKDPDGKNCFLLTVGKSNYRTLALPNRDSPSYFKLDAMCPALCDGLDPR